MLKKIIMALVLTFAFFALLYSESAKNSPISEKAPAVTGTFKIEVLKTGKSDAMILYTENHTVIIDCGETEDAQKVLDTLAAKNINDADYMFITHFDKDHVGGAPEVIDNIDIRSIVVPDYSGNSKEYERYIESCRKRNISPVRLKEKLSFVLDDVLFEVYPPMKSEYAEGDNDFSLAICVTHGENTFLFAGDAEAERIKEFEKQFKPEHIFLKVPHHGRYNDETEKFLKSVSPSYAVITCGRKTPPDDRVISILESLGCETFLTANGRILIESNGKKLNLQQKQ